MASYDLTKLRVTKADLDPKEIEELTSPEAAVFIQDPLSYILKPDDEAAYDVDHGLLKGQPYWDPALKGSRPRMREFL